MAHEREAVSMTTMAVAVPQHLDALAKANAVRIERCRVKRAVGSGEVTLEQATAFDLLERHAGGARIPDVSLQWLDRIVVSIDFGAFLDAPLVQHLPLERRQVLPQRVGARPDLRGLLLHPADAVAA
jgi:hypothetical protein